MNQPLATDRSAPKGKPDAAAEDDYRSFCAALSESARGREFLAEYARRNRHADTQMLLAALDRLESTMRADGAALERLRDELRMLLIAVRVVRPEIDAASPPAKAAKLAGLLDLLERRIDGMVEGTIISKPVELAAPAAAAIQTEIPRPPLSVVPKPDEPELPIPAPAAAEAWRPIALVRLTAAMPEVTFVESAPLAAAPVASPEPAATAATTLPPVDPLADIYALSDEERIALFS